MNIRKNMFFYVIIVLAILSSCEMRAFAKSWYVDNSSSGGNGSSWSRAWNSFDVIHWTSVKPGDTIFISGGNSSKIYYETLTVSKEGSPGNPITIRIGSDPGHNGTVIIDAEQERSECIRLNKYVTLDGEVDSQIKLICRNALANGIFASSGDAEGVIIRYVEVYNCGTEGQPGGFAHGILLNEAVNSTISYSHIHDNYKDGINLVGSSGTWGSNKIHHNHIHHNGDDGVTGRHGLDIYNNKIHDQDNVEVGHPDGIQTLGNYIRVYNNEIFNVIHALIFIDPLRIGSGGYVQVYNNLLYQTNSNYEHSRGISIKAETGTTSLLDIIIANNTIVDLTFMGIHVSSAGGPIHNMVIKNNLIYNCSTNSSYGTAININEGEYNVADVVIDYNLINAGSNGVARMAWQGEPFSYSTFVSQGYGQSHGITGVPKFIHYSERGLHNDFHLAEEDTAARSNGKDLSYIFLKDKDGRTRKTWDIGCFEFSNESSIKHDILEPNPPTGFRIYTKYD